MILARSIETGKEKRFGSFDKAITFLKLDEMSLKAGYRYTEGVRQGFCVMGKQPNSPFEDTGGHWILEEICK